MTAQDGFNVADLVFLQQMIPHHQLAVQLSSIALASAASPQVRQIAQDVQTETPPEIAQMGTELSSLRIDVDLTGTGGGHSHGGSGPTAADVAGLKSLSGAAFDSRFLALMIEHELSAVELAQSEAVDGQNLSARKLAATIAGRGWDRAAAMRKLPQTDGS